MPANWVPNKESLDVVVDAVKRAGGHIESKSGQGITLYLARVIPIDALPKRLNKPTTFGAHQQYIARCVNVLSTGSRRLHVDKAARHTYRVYAFGYGGVEPVQVEDLLARTPAVAGETKRCDREKYQNKRELKRQKFEPKTQTQTVKQGDGINYRQLADNLLLSAAQVLSGQTDDAEEVKKLKNLVGEVRSANQSLHGINAQLRQKIETLTNANTSLSEEVDRLRELNKTLEHNNGVLIAAAKDAQAVYPLADHLDENGKRALDKLMREAPRTRGE